MLKKSINKEFWIENKGMYASIKTGEPENCVIEMFDLLGESLAIYFGVADEDRSKMILENYPHGEAGPSVISPQLPEIPIYHNRGMWPFVTAYSLRAAKMTGNAKVINNNLESIIKRF